MSHFRNAEARCLERASCSPGAHFVYQSERTIQFSRTEAAGGARLLPAALGSRIVGPEPLLVNTFSWGPAFFLRRLRPARVEHAGAASWRAGARAFRLSPEGRRGGGVAGSGVISDTCVSRGAPGTGSYPQPFLSAALRFRGAPCRGPRNIVVALGLSKRNFSTVCAFVGRARNCGVLLRARRTYRPGEALWGPARVTLGGGVRSSQARASRRRRGRGAARRRRTRRGPARARA